MTTRDNREAALAALSEAQLKIYRAERANGRTHWKALSLARNAPHSQEDPQS
jgi:hypothetical protein